MVQVITLYNERDYFIYLLLNTIYWAKKLLKLYFIKTKIFWKYLMQSSGYFLNSSTIETRRS